jgi:peptidoglycan hydrolase-like protein with peptidoglycan-binding domain
MIQALVHSSSQMELLAKKATQTPGGTGIPTVGSNHLSHRLAKQRSSRRFWLSLLSSAIGAVILGGSSIALAFQAAVPQRDAAITLPSQPLLLSQVGNLEFGDIGDRVAEIQQLLQDAGFYDGAIDGDFGEGTETAVIRFQESRGLVPDGVVGADTEAALRGSGAAVQAAPSSTPADSFSTPTYRLGERVLQNGDVGDDVAELQELLRDAGTYDGAIDGDFGEGTRAAVIEFQRSQGLEQDGVVGEQTLTRLRNPVANRPSTPSAQFNTRSDCSGGRYSVEALQERLNDRGFNAGQIDCIQGSDTRAAIGRAQREYGLSPSDFER